MCMDNSYTIDCFRTLGLFKAHPLTFWDHPYEGQLLCTLTNASFLHQQGPNSKLYKALISPCLTLLSPVPLQTLGHMPRWFHGHILLWFSPKKGKTQKVVPSNRSKNGCISLRATRAWGWYSGACSREAISPGPKNPLQAASLPFSLPSLALNLRALKWDFKQFFLEPWRVQRILHIKNKSSKNSYWATRSHLFLPFPAVWAEVKAEDLAVCSLALFQPACWSPSHLVPAG